MHIQDEIDMANAKPQCNGNPTGPYSTNRVGGQIRSQGFALGPKGLCWVCRLGVGSVSHFEYKHVGICNAKQGVWGGGGKVRLPTQSHRVCVLVEYRF